MTLSLARRTECLKPSAVREILKVAERPDILSFAGGLPAPELFPAEAIAAAHREIFATEAAAALQYSSTEGYLPLREWIAARLQGQGIDAHPERTLITSGSQQGIDLAARVLIDPGATVAVEDPSYVAALQSMGSFEARFLPIPSDDAGMQVDRLEELAERENVRVIYLVPNFQNPRGTTLSLERRHRLVALAARLGIAIIEDDPYGELRFKGEALPALAALDTEGVVLRLGSFSKTLAPGLRIGFATGPQHLIRAMTVAKQACDLQSGTLAQRVASKLLHSSFDFEGHLQTLRGVYGERRDTMLAALERFMPREARWTRPDGGMFVWVTLPGVMRAEDLFPAAIEQKIAFVPGSGFFAGEKRYECMRLNYTNCRTDLIAGGMERLGRVVSTAIADNWHLRAIRSAEEAGL
jgi:2-aminoadipate transaminase